MPSQAPAARAFKSFARRVLNWPIPDIPGGYLEFFVENLIHQPEFENSLSNEVAYARKQPPQPIGQSFLKELNAEQAAEIERRMALAKSNMTPLTGN